jgi:hypothetical protein
MASAFNREEGNYCWQVSAEFVSIMEKKNIATG